MFEKNVRKNVRKKCSKNKFENKFEKKVPKKKNSSFFFYRRNKDVTIKHFIVTSLFWR